MFKIIRNILIVLVLLAISYVAFARFTNLIPKNFNLFKSETTLSETPVMVEQIKDIGELIGAEFYGEVYADLFTSYNDLIEEHGDSLSEISSKYKYLDDYAKLKVKLEDLKTKKEQQKILLDTLAQRIKQSDSAQKVYKIYLDSLELILKDLPKGKKNSDERDRYSYVQNEIKEMNALLDKASENYQESSKNEKKLTRDKAYTDRKLSKQKDELTDYIRKRNLVYIGRGHISAGFIVKNLDLSQIDTTENKSISFYLPEVQIIDTVINPWYYKTDKDSLLGYEIYINKKDRYYTNDDVMLVKQKCRKNLAESALDKGLMDLAEKNGKNALESFFMLLGFKEVKIIEKVEE